MSGSAKASAIAYALWFVVLIVAALRVGRVGRIGRGLRTESRGHGVGRQAQRQVVEYVFAHTRAERVQAWTDVDNVAEHRALDAAGFQREGVIRSGQWRAGQWHDQVLYPVLRADG